MDKSIIDMIENPQHSTKKVKIILAIYFFSVLCNKKCYHVSGITNEWFIAEEKATKASC